MTKVALTGAWRVESPSELQGTVLMPGTLDTNGLGHDDQELSADYGSGKPGPIGSRLTRRHTFEGTVRLSRQIRWTPQPGRGSSSKWSVLAAWRSGWANVWLSPTVRRP